MKQDYYAEMKDIVVNIQPSAEGSIVDGNERLIEDLGLSSLELVSLIMEIESRYGFSFDNELVMLDCFETVNKLAGFVGTVVSDMERAAAESGLGD